MILNFYISIVAWAAFNFIKFSIEKDKFDEQDKEFPIWSYIKKNWDNWAASFLMIPVLLWLGYRQLDIITNPLSEHSTSVKWNDFYYLLSGVLTEGIIYAYKKWKSR